MTVEIKQLLVRAVVETKRQAEPAAPQVQMAPVIVDHSAIVDACTRQVLRELNRAKER